MLKRPSAGGRVLVVDDDPDIREVLTSVLEDEATKSGPRRTAGRRWTSLAGGART
jgi:CheY-like chemotaxis protein